MAQSGIPNLTILQAATINAAQALNIDSQLGSIEANKIADLVIVKQNPLTHIETLKHPVAVVKQGQWLSQKQLQHLQVQAKNTRGYYWSFFAFVDDIVERL